MASNHTMDWGPEALLDTHALLTSMGKHVIGAGADGEAARKPAIVERNGVRIAFLGYCTVLRPGAEAGPGKPGCAPMRAHTSYAPVDWQAGAPPKVLTVPHEEDLRALEEDVRKAKQHADVVVLSMHWGLHHMPKTICDYQPVVAHAAIDAGADLIVGHHAHCIKAVEVYKGKVCFYSVGNFMTSGGESRLADPARRNVWNLWWFKVAPECLPPHGMYYFPDDARKTMLVKAVFSKSGVERVSFLPAYVNGKGQPERLLPDDPRFDEVLEFTEWVSDCHPHRFRVDGSEVVVEAQERR
jgi:poly-gamma-glutamate synthesis protein (capsule biosynthesis protein)